MFKVRRSAAKVRVVVGMSGGVDSSLAAALLLKKGYEVIGVTFRMWPKEECGSSLGRACCNLESVTRARVVSEQLKIPYYVLDFSEEFRKKVIDYFCQEYLRGHTPNPCVICNEKIKFGKLLEKARSLGAAAVATGHYANVIYSRHKKRYLLKEGRDKKRDQTYFLFSLSQDQLRQAIFPLGDLTKENVRETAKRLKLFTYDTPSSQDVCFIYDKKYGEYIRKKTGVDIKRGDIVNLRGRTIGQHKGIPFYTIGQRRGLGVAYKEPLYVVRIDVRNNRIVVGTKSDVLKGSLIAEKVNWISIDPPSRPLKVSAKIRYNHKKASAVLSRGGNGNVKVEFDHPQEAPTPGQAVVFYDRDIVIGGGWIKEST